MDFENFMGFLPLLIFVITVVIDKSNRKKRRNRTGHFPPLPDMDSSRENRETYDVTGTQQSKKESTDKTVYKEEAPAAGRESKKPWYVEFPEDREAKQRGKVFESFRKTGKQNSAEKFLNSRRCSQLIKCTMNRHL